MEGASAGADPRVRLSILKDIALKRRRKHTKQYCISFAPVDFEWQGEPAHDLPIITTPEGTVCEPLLRFFGWSFRYKRAVVSSMRDEAYILREWMQYLFDRHLRWDLVDDQTMIDWRKLLKRRNDAAPDDEKPMQDRRIARRLEVVFTFYDLAMASNQLDRDLVGPFGPVTCWDKERNNHPSRHTFRMGSERHKKISLREWACADPATADWVKRSIPDDSAVLAVLTHLRNSPDDDMLRDRNWLIGRVMAEAGLRRAEVADLTISALENALKEERIRIPPPKDGSQADTRYKGLDSIANSEHGRKAILGGLDWLENDGRIHIFVKVKGKGNKTRLAPFPIDLVRDLLIIGIWGCRKIQLQRRWGQSPGPPQLFLSEKTKGRMEPGTIGDILKDAFNKCNIEGSGHRLRSFFATKLAERLWAKHFSDNLFRWDQSVENTVLVELAQALGHAHPNISVRYYLDLGRVAYFRLGDKSGLRAMRKIVNALADNHRRLTPEFMDRIRKLINIRGTTGIAGATLDKILNDILCLADQMLPRTTENTNIDANPSPRRDPEFRIVPKKER